MDKKKALEKPFYKTLHQAMQPHWANHPFLSPIYRDLPTRAIRKGFSWAGLSLFIGFVATAIFTYQLDFNRAFASIFCTILIPLLIKLMETGIEEIQLSEEAEVRLSFLEILINSLDYDCFIKDRPDLVPAYLLSREDCMPIIQNLFDAWHAKKLDENKLRELFIFNFQNLVNEKSHEIFYYGKNPPNHQLSTIENRLDTICALLQSEEEHTVLIDKSAFMESFKTLSSDTQESLKKELDNMLHQGCAKPDSLSHADFRDFLNQRVLR